MRSLIVIAVAFWTTIAPVSAARVQAVEFGSADSVLRWINAYRQKPDLASVPAAMRALSQFGAFKDPDASGVYVGFIAGIIGSNPERADDVIERMFPVAPEDQWALVRAIAYSGLPNWKPLLEKFADRMPTRRVMIDKYLAGQLPTLLDIETVANPTLFEKLRGYVTFEKFRSKPKHATTALEPSADLLDTYWGYYFATGKARPVSRLIAMLPLAKDRDSVEKLTVGSMAKYTLANNAARDAALLTTLKRASLHQPKDTLVILNEVIDAAESVNVSRIRKEALAAIEELKIKGPGSRRDMAWWGQVGEGAIGVGCVAAAALGQVALGLPCVIGGATSSAAIKYLATP